MGRIKLDGRIRAQIERGVANRWRSLFIIIGDKAKDQAVTLHHILAKTTTGGRPSVLWCYKKETEFSSHRKKRIKELKKRKESGLYQSKEDNLFEQFILSTQIRYCYYADSHRILGNTFGMAVLQDFEALTPNLLARTVETVEGGGLVVLLIQSVASLKQLFTMSMDVHKRYRTEAHADVVGRFNERFILSLASCANCVVMDDCLNVLPISSSVLNMADLPPVIAQQKNAAAGGVAPSELARLQQSLADTKPIGPLLHRCRTLCQAKALLRLLDLVTDKMSNSMCAITAARGRGKSAAMGLAVAGAVGCNLTNIFVTSPTPENVRTLFDFVLRGFDAIGYQEHADFDVVRSLDPQTDKCVTRVNIFRRHRQTIQYIHPSEFVKLGQAELLVIDEAAAIPMQLVKQLIHGNFLVFLASTTNGYEGTGRSLSLKLLEQLRRGGGGTTTATGAIGGSDAAETATTARRRPLFELTLEESIRYAMNDPVEDWLNQTLCLNSQQSLPTSLTGTPAPDKCELYYVNRDSLFSFHKAAEVFLANLMSIYVAAHYKNSPDDLQMLADAPAHHLFVLMAPVPADQSSVPQILAVVQLCLEGSISKQSVTNVRDKGKKRAAGDLIPWTLCQHFLDDEFPTLCGARIVRVAVHPNFQGMGYGSQAVRLLLNFYGQSPRHVSTTTAVAQCQNGEDKNGGIDEEEDGEMSEVQLVDDGDLHKLLLHDEQISPRANLPPLLVRLADYRRHADQLDYVGVSFGLTLALLKFWKRLGFVPVYLRQNTNDLTGEHSCVMVRKIAIAAGGKGSEHGEDDDDENGRMDDGERRHRHAMPQNSAAASGATLNSDGTWLSAFFVEFRRRFVSLLGTSFSAFSPHLAFSLMFMDSASIGCSVQQQQGEQSAENGLLDRAELRLRMSDLDLRRVAQYCRNLADLALISDLLPTIAGLYFTARVDTNRAPLDLSQAAVLLGVGLQRKMVETVANELALSTSQTHALLNKAIRRLSEYFDSICREALEQQQQKHNANDRQQHIATEAEAKLGAKTKSDECPAIKKLKISHFVK
ncbi:hypothetical protein niasHS_018111 [Heterodera schachtii]|uniref:RNA cytidine acetyltransferase n=1 Tax=Heterodera schachtii TaxID=97005 RepID=A0ABD2HWJ6_HETSC